MSDVSGRARGPPRGGSDELSDAAPRVAKTDTVYSDRFVPSRSASAGLRGFNLLDGAAPPASASHPSSEREDTSAAYSTLLRAELLGDNNAAGLASPPRTGLGASSTPPTSSFAPASASHAPIASSRRYSHASPPSRNLFRFKTLRAAGGLGDRPDSPYSLSPVGGDGPLGTTATSPRRAPRKIARSPFKVLDAPALQDDFYLNLVDWSSHNVLAVGLGTCVYLWSACTSRVTKLCDLGPSDSVCSVAWTQRGTYLAVGTNQGETQLWDATKCKRVRAMGGHRTRVGTRRSGTTQHTHARHGSGGKASLDSNLLDRHPHTNLKSPHDDSKNEHGPPPASLLPEGESPNPMSGSPPADIAQ